MLIHNGSLAEHVWSPCYDATELGNRKGSWNRMQRIAPYFFHEHKFNVCYREYLWWTCLKVKQITFLLSKGY